jgi:hypothetical protein
MPCFDFAQHSCACGLSKVKTRLKPLRGNQSRNTSDETTQKTTHLVDFLHLNRNTVSVTN